MKHVKFTRLVNILLKVKQRNCLKCSFINAKDSFSHLFRIEEAFLQKVTHEGVCMMIGLSPERVIPVSVPLKLKPKPNYCQDNKIKDMIKAILYFYAITNSNFFHLKLSLNKSTFKTNISLVPSANIYHCLKIHKFFHQSFGDLCSLLEMDIV